jgi:hypothetical protein
MRDLAGHCLLKGVSRAQRPKVRKALGRPLGSREIRELGGPAEACTFDTLI